MTKVFTALVLADMVRRGEVALEDPIAKYLPAGARVPELERAADHPPRRRDSHVRAAIDAGWIDVAE